MTERNGGLMGDLISRKAAIDAIMDADVCVTWNGVISDDDAVDIAIKSTKGSVISSIVNLPSAQPEKRTHERTETHACDLISRQAAMEEISKQQTYKMFEGEDTLYLDANDVGSVLASLPPAQPDLSGYSDKLWKKAYERGKAEAQAEIVRCKDCEYFRKDHGWNHIEYTVCAISPIHKVIRKPDDFCSKAERRTDG